MTCANADGLPNCRPVQPDRWSSFIGGELSLEPPSGDIGPGQGEYTLTWFDDINRSSDYIVLVREYPSGVLARNPIMVSYS